MGYFMLGKYKNKSSYSIFKRTHFSKKDLPWRSGSCQVLQLNLTCSNTERVTALLSLLELLILCSEWKCVNS